MSKGVPKEVALVRRLPVANLSAMDSSVSYSQYLSFKTCPHQWYLRYVKKEGIYTPTVHTAFGTSVHEVLQEWLTVMYEKTVKQAMEMDLNKNLYEKLKTVYLKEKIKAGDRHFSSAEELQSFYEDGVKILDYLKKNRNLYFTSKNTYLVKVELPLLQRLSSGVFFKGFIDLVFYNKVSGTYTIVDIKTSTSGWNEYAKKDDNKTSQIILYKEFFSRQFNVDPDKIHVNYIILKRRVPTNPEYARMGKRVQEFMPLSGKIKRTRIVESLEKFINECFDGTGKIVDKEYNQNVCKNSCTFCEFKTKKDLCNQAVFF